MFSLYVVPACGYEDGAHYSLIVLLWLLLLLLLRIDKYICTYVCSIDYCT